MKKSAKPMQGRRRAGAAQDYVNGRLALGHVAFALAGLMKETGLSAIAAKRQLARLGNGVVRVSPRQSFFLIVGPEHRGAGAPPVEWWLEGYLNWVGRPYYLALQSAASVWGSNPQALQSVQVMTDQPCRSLKIGKIHVRFFVKRRVAETPTQPLAGAVAPLRVSTPASTVFDLIRYAVRIGGMERAVETIIPLLPKLRPHELKRVLDVEAELPTAQRLGFVLETQGQKKLAKVVRDWLPDKLAVVRLSSTNDDRKNRPLIKRWQVLNNCHELK